MLRPLRLHPHGEKVYLHWKRNARPEDIALVDELLRRISVGTWEGWRHSQLDNGDPNNTVITLYPNLLVSFVLEKKAGAGMFDLTYIGPDPENWPDGSRPLGQV